MIVGKSITVNLNGISNGPKNILLLCNVHSQIMVNTKPVIVMVIFSLNLLFVKQFKKLSILIVLISLLSKPMENARQLRLKDHPLNSQKQKTFVRSRMEV